MHSIKYIDNKNNTYWSLWYKEPKYCWYLYNCSKFIMAFRDILRPNLQVPMGMFCKQEQKSKFLGNFPWRSTKSKLSKLMSVKKGQIENRHPPDNQTLSGLYPIQKGVINSYPTHKRLITKSYPNCIHICYQRGADSLIRYTFHEILEFHTRIPYPSTLIQHYIVRYPTRIFKRKFLKFMIKNISNCLPILWNFILWPP